MKPFLRSILWKEIWWPNRRPYQCGPPVRIVDKYNFFQMTMLFFAYVVTTWGQLHFIGNIFFTVNFLQSTYCKAPTTYHVTSSTQQLLSPSTYFFRAALLENLLFQNTHFFTVVIATYSKRNLYQPATSCE